MERTVSGAEVCSLSLLAQSDSRTVEATPSFSDSVSSSGKWGYAQEPGSGCRELVQKEPDPASTMLCAL